MAKFLHYNFIYGILIASEWCALVYCTSGNIFLRGSSDLHREFGDSSESDVGQTVYGQNSGDSFIMYGDCSASKITTTVYSFGSGDIYLMYGYSSASSASSPSTANYPEIWARDMYNQGSGDLYIQYGSCSSSSDSKLALTVNNVGSGDIKIMYAGYDRSNVEHKITDTGSGKVYIMYSNSGSYAQRKANINEESEKEDK